MKVKNIIFEDFVNYKLPSMYIAFPSCSFKCDHECGRPICQNSALANEPDIEINKNEICELYMSNRIVQAVVCGGLEPMDSLVDLISFVDTLRRQYKCNDDIVIYTGYTEEELNEGNFGLGAQKFQLSLWNSLKQYDNIIVKFGRYKPNQESHFDKILGVRLASPNQYAIRVKGESE